MIRRVVGEALRGLVAGIVVLAGMLAGVARADDAAGAEAGATAGDPQSTDPIAAQRLPFDELVGRAIGSASQPVVFNWRRTRAQVAVVGSQVWELNAFETMRVGALGRFPTGGILTEVGASYVHTWDTAASRALAFTPYRQPGRPSRMELDVNVGLPLAEGVVTLAPRFFPAVHLVVNGYAGLRYSLYPDAFAGMKAGKIASAVLSPALTQDELDNLDDRRLDAMVVDPARYGLTVGFGNDIYFRPGLFVSPRATFGLPILAAASDSDLLFWGDLSIAVGYAR